MRSLMACLPAKDLASLTGNGSAQVDTTGAP